MSLGLADQIGTHVGRLGVYTAADTRKHGDNRAAERVSRKGHGKGRIEPDKAAAGAPKRLTLAGCRTYLVKADAEHKKHDEQSEQGTAGHAESHNRTALEGDLKGLGKRSGSACAVGNADIRIGGDLHTDPAGGSRHNSADNERDRGGPRYEHAEHHGDNNRDNRHDLILIRDKRVRPETDSRSDFAHTVRALRHAADCVEINKRISEPEDGGENDKPENQ